MISHDIKTDLLHKQNSGNLSNSHFSAIEKAIGRKDLDSSLRKIFKGATQSLQKMNPFYKNGGNEIYERRYKRVNIKSSGGDNVFLSCISVTLPSYKPLYVYVVENVRQKQVNAVSFFLREKRIFASDFLRTPELEPDLTLLAN